MSLIINFAFLFLLIEFTSAQRNSAENDLCGRGADSGICKNVKNCQEAKEVIKSGGRPPLCGFKGNDPLICCPIGGVSSNRRTNGPGNTGTTGDSRPLRATSSAAFENNGRKSISEQKCYEYAKSVFETVTIVGSSSLDEVTNHCALNAEEQIVGGERAMPKVYPHMALIGYVNKGVTDWQCGGSLISERFVLSAAHCSEVTIRHRTYHAEWVRLGELDLESELDDASPMDIEIVKRFVHPSYNKTKFYNDIALFQLASDVVFNKYIRPICLQNSYDVDTHKFKPVVTGWGRLSFKGHPSADLQQLKVDLVNHNTCKERFKRYEQGSSSFIPRGIDNATMICAGGEQGKDSCRGDSGGPLQVQLSVPYCMFSQIGIVSFGNQCAVGYPGVYTRVSYFVPWIESIVWSQ